MSGVRFVYLAEPIDQALLSPVTYSDRIGAITELNKIGVGVFRPARAFSVDGVRPGPEVTQINTAALGVCDAVLAFLPKGVATVGVPIEIEQAVAAGKWVAVVTDHVGWAMERPEYNLLVFTNWLDAVIWLGTLDGRSTETEYDSSIPFAKTRANTAVDVTTLGDIGRVMLGEVIELPKRGYDDDAGLDLTCSADTVIKPGTFEDVPTGVACGFPPGVWGMIIGRSSTLRKKRLMVNQAVIDPGYRGELFTGAFNLSDEPVIVRAGERIAQMVLLPSLSHLQPKWVDTLPASHDGRDVNGFGSTG